MRRMKRDLISILDVSKDLQGILDLAYQLKRSRGIHDQPLKGKTLAMIFEKASTRTRVSFEVAMAELGGNVMYLSSKDMQLGRGETIEDTAKVLSRYVHGIMYRANSHVVMMDLAENASIPVINGLDDLEHPCQILADLLTIMDSKGDLKGLKMSYFGDGNNVCNSLMLGAALCGMHFYAACPKGRKPDPAIVEEAEAIAKARGGSVTNVFTAQQAAKDADILYTDVWVSMGDKLSKEEAIKVFSPFQVNEALLDLAKDDCMVMHCLPAHRGEEISAAVMDGPNSVVFDQAENRLHAQKAVLMTFMK